MGRAKPPVFFFKHCPILLPQLGFLSSFPSSDQLRFFSSTTAQISTTYNPALEVSSINTFRSAEAQRNNSLQQLIFSRGRGFLTNSNCDNTVRHLTLERAPPHPKHISVSGKSPTSTTSSVFQDTSITTATIPPFRLLRPTTSSTDQTHTVQHRSQKLFMYQHDKIPVHRHSDPPIPLQLFRNPRKPCSPNLSPDG